jgi:hypothetical protein
MGKSKDKTKRFATRHFDERLAATVALDPVCARGEISNGYAMYFGCDRLAREP